MASDITLYDNLGNPVAMNGEQMKDAVNTSVVVQTKYVVDTSGGPYEATTSATVYAVASTIPPLSLTTEYDNSKVICSLNAVFGFSDVARGIHVSVDYSTDGGTTWSKTSSVGFNYFVYDSSSTSNNYASCSGDILLPGQLKGTTISLRVSYAPNYDTGIALFRNDLCNPTLSIREEL